MRPRKGSEMELETQLSQKLNKYILYFDNIYVLILKLYKEKVAGVVVIVG